LPVHCQMLNAPACLLLQHIIDDASLDSVDHDMTRQPRAQLTHVSVGSSCCRPQTC
jgi:hypothetical protein